jgi:hypothetical protein
MGPHTEWQSFQVRPLAMGAVVVEQVRRQLELALAINLPLSAEVAVRKRDCLDTVRFFFSAAAVELFKTLVQYHGARPCRAPPAGRGTIWLWPPAT